MSSSQSTSSRALLYFSERVEDATEAVKGLIGGSTATKYVDTSDDVVRAQLESDRDEVRLEGLKTVVALISKGREASGYFASVVKLSSNANLEIRKLVYIVVRRYARRQPEIALLGINSFQRDLQDRNEVIRAMALRVLAGLRLKLAASVVEMAIGKCVRDSSFHVRKAAALALIKCADISPNSSGVFRGHVTTLLDDRNPAVLAVALVAWSRICPKSLEMLHPRYRKLCYALSDMNEWGQQKSIVVLGHYAKHFLRPHSVEQRGQQTVESDKDLILLLNRCRDLLQSQNAAVVRCAARLLYDMGDGSHRASVISSMVRLTQGDGHLAYLALLDCLYVAQQSPHLLEPCTSDFLPRSSLNEPNECTSIKLQILALLGQTDTDDFVRSELLEHAQHHPSSQVSATAVDALGTYLLQSTDETRRISCMLQLIDLLRSRRSDDLVVARTVAVICKAIKSAKGMDAASYVVRLASMLFTQPSAKDLATKRRIKLVGRNTIKSSFARAAIYWLIGQYSLSSVEVTSSKDGNIASQRKTIGELLGPDILRRAAINFAKEDIAARLQIITLSTKLFVTLPTTEGFTSTVPEKSLLLLHGYVLQLARYDTDFDVRDRGRLYKALTERLDSSSSNTKTDVTKTDEVTDEKLSGVVLRRDQVLHIVLEEDLALQGDSVQEGRRLSRKWDNLSWLIGERQAASLPFIVKDFFNEPWADVDTLPPASVREPPANVATVEKSSLPASQEFTDSYSSAPTLLTQKSAQSIVSAAPSKYRDLDAFLDGEDDTATPPLAEVASYVQAISEGEEEDGEVAEEEEEEEEEERNESESESEHSHASSGAAPAAQFTAAKPLAVSFNEENAWAS